MFKDFVTLFTGMKAVTSVMLIVGLILCIVKIFQPGQRTFGYLGATFLVLGVVFRMVNGMFYYFNNKLYYKRCN